MANLSPWYISWSVSCGSLIGNNYSLDKTGESSVMETLRAAIGMSLPQRWRQTKTREDKENSTLFRK